MLWLQNKFKKMVRFAYERFLIFLRINNSTYIHVEYIHSIQNEKIFQNCFHFIH